MVDAVNLCFVEMRREHRVECLGRCQIATERFFNNDTAFAVCDAMQVQTFCEIAKEARRDREIERAHNAVPHQTSKLRPTALAFGVNRNIVETRKELCDRFLFRLLGTAEFLDRVCHKLAEPFGIHLRACSTNDPRFRGHLPRQITAEQARQDFTAGQIARAPKNH